MFLQNLIIGDCSLFFLDVLTYSFTRLNDLYDGYTSVPATTNKSNKYQLDFAESQMLSKY